VHATDREAIMAGARIAAGLQDFGKDMSFQTGLDVLLRDVAELADRPALQAQVLDRITGFLVTRLRLVEDARLHPEICEQSIERPIFVVGLPRSGTTITYDMLALDPGVRYPREWELALPWPATEAATIDRDPRIDIIQPIFDAVVEASPELLNVHRFDCRAPGECNTGMMGHFSSVNWISEFGARHHAEWLIETVPQGHFAEHKRLLQQMQWKGPKGRWLLKGPQHIFHMPALFETYPDARIVWTHRDPVAIFSSVSDLILLTQRAAGFDPDPHELGDLIRRKWTAGILNALRDRAAHPEIDRAIIDQPHRAIIADPLGVMHRNLAFLGQPLTEEFDARMRAFLADDAKSGRLGKHHHSLERFGLDPDVIRRELEPYYARFGAMF
jgi:hypothetical protein